MKICLVLLFLLSSYSFAQQSSPSIEWSTISNKYVNLIYPKYMKNESIYIANLVEHYASVVGLTYDIQSPKQFTLLIRPELASPNGFVTLGPRRSEWFSSANFSNFVGASEWYQTLAIHEYRHIIQFDNFESGWTRFANFLFGDMGKTIVLFSGLHPWYMEGDAVWAETKYTDAGRGRSPYFMARLKALVLSDQVPTYNEFVNGTYTNSIPNHYVLGYVLISSATKKYGEKFWSQVVKKIASAPHPFRLYSAFKEVSGTSFLDFYEQTMNDLKTKWSDDKEAIAQVKKTQYRDNIYPFKIESDFYFLHYDLDNYWKLVKKSGQLKEEIFEIPFEKGLTQLDISKSKAVYTELASDKRFSYKSSSNIFILDLEKNEKIKITDQKRYYFPKLNKAANQIIAVEFTEKQEWNIVILNLEGEVIKNLRIDNYNVTQADFSNNNEEVVAIISDKNGFKSIAKINLNTKKIETLLPPSRNNIYSLNVDIKNNILFEAQVDGYIQIIKLNLASIGNFQKCSDAKIASYSPFSDGEKLFYSNQDAYGSQILSTSLENCTEIDVATLTNFNYLSEGPSDNYNHFPIQNFKDQELMYKDSANQYAHNEYGHVDKRLFTPHSWSFFTGRGFGFLTSTTNYLGTLGFNVSLGRDSEEKENFGSFSFDFKKYYPIFSIGAESRNRFADIYASSYDLEWNEKSVDLSVTLPYLYTRGLYSFNSALFSQISYLSASDFEISDSNLGYKDRSYRVVTSGANFMWSKEMKKRSIIAPYLFSATLNYSDAKNKDNKLSNYRFYNDFQLNIPGLFNHDSLFFTFTTERMKDLNSAYKFLATKKSMNNYVFSRGYKYTSVANYEKWTANYLFPVGYPNFDLNFLFIQRVFSTLFYDTTKIDSKYKVETLASYGLDLQLETKLFRLIPIYIGATASYKKKTQEFVYDYGISTTVPF